MLSAQTTRWRPPGQCEVCRAWCRTMLCTECSQSFAAPRSRCRQCGLGLAGGAMLCGECLRDPPPFGHAVCAVDYAFPWNRLIAGFKFHGRTELAPLLAAQLAQAVAADGGAAPDLVLPMPLHTGRLAERGYNQAWELARRIAPVRAAAADADLLQRPVPGSAQAGLARAERMAHLRGAFMVDPRRRALLQGRHIALVDDVLTTGATAREAATTLLRAGAAAVEVWVLARTP